MSPRRAAATADPPQRRRILHAAAGFLAENGFHGMSMRDLAHAATTTPSNLYNYFGSKEEILFAIQREAFETLIASAEQATAGIGDPVERLYLFIAHHVRYCVEHADVMRVLVHQAALLPAARRRTIRNLKERYFRMGCEILRELLAQGCGELDTPAGRPADDAEVERITYNVFGMLNWIYGWYDPERHGSPSELARTIHRIVICGAVSRCPFQPIQQRADERLEVLAARPLLGPEPVPEEAS